MKIAAVTDDGHTISAHFGRATHYVIFKIEGDEIVGRELVEKAGHHTFQQEGHHHEGSHHDDQRGHGFGAGARSRHTRMIEPIQDCDILLARGMGRGARAGLEEAGIRTILTGLQDVDEAVRQVMEGTIVDDPDRLH